MVSKDSSRAATLRKYHILTVLEDRAESAGPPPMPAGTTEAEEDGL
jgi:hypothetical protein